MAFVLVGNSLPVNAMTTKAALPDYQAEVAVALENQVNAVAAGAGDYGLMDDIQGSSILHCWNWSYKTIEENMEIIAECGYTAVQTSLARHITLCLSILKLIKIWGQKMSIHAFVVEQ